MAAMNSNYEMHPSKQSTLKDEDFYLGPNSPLIQLSFCKFDKIWFLTIQPIIKFKMIYLSLLSNLYFNIFTLLKL